MKTLWLLRHAKSSWSDSSLDDHERPLNERGRRGAQTVGKFMKQTKLEPPLVLCSTAIRARETFEILLEVTGFAPETEYRQSLYLSSRHGLIDHITSLAESSNAVMIVGHNNGMEELLAYLTGAEKRMPTAALAEIKFDIDDWQQVKRNSGKLQWLITPKELQKE